MTENSADRRIELQLDRRISLSVNVGPLESVDVQGVTAAACWAEESFKRSCELVSGGQVDEAVFCLVSRIAGERKLEVRSIHGEVQ